MNNDDFFWVFINNNNKLNLTLYSIYSMFTNNIYINLFI